MPKSGTFGSGRGVSGNGHPYRDHSGVMKEHRTYAMLAAFKPQTDSSNVMAIIQRNALGLRAASALAFAAAAAPAGALALPFEAPAAACASIALACSRSRSTRSRN